MLKKFIIFVIDDLSGSATPEELVAIDAFNDSLRAKGHWIFAGGLADLPPPCRTKVMEQSPLISENSGYETIQIYR